MTDTELLDALESKPYVRVPAVGRALFAWNVEVEFAANCNPWQWYDHRGAPAHHGWTKAASLREALACWLEAAKEIETHH